MCMSWLISFVLTSHSKERKANKITKWKFMPAMGFEHNIVVLGTVGKSFYFAIFAPFAFLVARLRPYKWNQPWHTPITNALLILTRALY